MQFGEFFFDGDKKVIYEAPTTGFSFVVDGGGYRVYTPDDIPSAPKNLYYSTYDVWSRAVDFLNAMQWSEIILALTGGSFRYTNQNAEDVFALIDIRLQNDWALVPADYAHNMYITGNLYPNLATEIDFDVSRLTAQGVSPRVLFADRGERVVSASAEIDTVAPVWDTTTGIVNAYQNGNAINISWGSASDANEVRYNIYVSTSDASVFDDANLLTASQGHFYPVTACTVEALQDATTYYIGVRAIDIDSNETQNTNYATVLFTAVVDSGSLTQEQHDQLMQTATVDDVFDANAVFS